MTRRAGQLLAGAAVVSAANTYWHRMSPYGQRFGAFPYAGEGADKVVALTFDDGPNEPYTSQIADALADFGVRGTFFQVGRNVLRDPDSSRALLAQGHVIGNHSYSHRFSRSVSNRAALAEVDLAQDVLAEQLGVTPALYRPPWLIRSRLLLDHLGRRGLQPVSGTFCHPLETAQVSSRRILRGSLRHLRPGAMLIFHDGYNDRGAARAQTVDAVQRTLEALSEDGYRCVTVDELLGVPAYR